MKKLFFISVLLALISFVACEDNEANDVSGRQYLYQNDTMYFSVCFVSKYEATVNIYVHGMLGYGGLGRCDVTGEYPVLTITCPDSYNKVALSMTCTFKDVNSFDAIVGINNLPSIWTRDRYRAVVPEQMHFNSYIGSLDPNYDGMTDDASFYTTGIFRGW